MPTITTPVLNGETDILHLDAEEIALIQKHRRDRAWNAASADFVSWTMHPDTFDWTHSRAEQFAGDFVRLSRAHASEFVGHLRALRAD